jgi:pyruvate/2-oxoglutarate dehydrogenase complex dihydrolipoamide dehydrogenase (E3) component
MHEARRGADLGFTLSSPLQVDFAKVMERVRRIRSMSSAGDAVQVMADAGVDVYLGQTTFVKPNAITVDDRELRFKKAVIATGARAVAPPIEGLKEGDYLTNETVFSLTEIPRKLVVLGGGPMGCELAQAFRRLGAEVDLVHPGSSLLPKDEPEAGQVLRRQFEREGIRLHYEFRAVRTRCRHWPRRSTVIRPRQKCFRGSRFHISQQSRRPRSNSGGGASGRCVQPREEESLNTRQLKR